VCVQDKTQDTNDKNGADGSRDNKFIS